MAETKDNTLSIIALVAAVAIVGMVVAFAISSKGSTQTTPVYVTAPASGDATNSAGQMKASGLCDDDEGYEQCKINLSPLGDQATILRACWLQHCG